MTREWKPSPNSASAPTPRGHYSCEGFGVPSEVSLASTQSLFARLFLAGAPPAADVTDGRLPVDALTRRDPAAFEALVSRHGPTVWAVCRRQLRNPADAEDAFQATFLVLLRKGDR